MHAQMHAAKHAMITPQPETPEIARALGLDRMGATLYMKREDLHPYGSHKGRSIPPMIDFKANQGARDFIISSSGNAALAAIRHIQRRNTEKDTDLHLTVFIGEHINPAKKKALEDEITDHERISLRESPRPLRAIFDLLRRGTGKTSLRQSTDDDALTGYAPLAREIMPTPGLSAVFLPASSGTSAQAIAEYFLAHGKETDNQKSAGQKPGDASAPCPAVHIVQTPGFAPIACELCLEENDLDPPNPSLADAIVDRVAHRRERLVAAVRATGGTGWIAQNDDIREAQRLLRDHANIEATGNGALALAGLIHALKSGATFRGAVVCVVTGK